MLCRKQKIKPMPMGVEMEGGCCGQAGPVEVGRGCFD